MAAGKSITLVAAMGLNRAIGLDGKMPWHLPVELQHFKRTTMGRTIVMGRKTWQTIGRPLPGRQNVVVSRNPEFHADGVEVAGSLAKAMEIATSDEVMVIGGGELYALAMPLASRMVLTLIDIEPRADTWFPAWDEHGWQQAILERVDADESNPLAYSIVELTRLS
ncbi:MAG: dihydrofolate reductase [Lysobacterales bacterium]|jgi:dihydrofolate reductase